MFHRLNQAFRIISFLGWCPNMNPTCCCECEGWLIWPKYVFPVIWWPAFVIITPSISPFSTVLSNQRFSNCSYTLVVEALVRMFLWKRSSKWTLSSTVTFTAVLLWFIDTILFNVWQYLSLGFGFQPLFLLAVDVLPWLVYVIITLETAALNTPNKVAILVTDAPAKCTPTIRPLWNSEESLILQYFHTNCY